MTTVPRTRAPSRFANGIPLMGGAQRRALAREPEAGGGPG